MIFNKDIGLLILRLGIGIMFILHGYPKIQGGVDTWTWLGSNGMGSIGIHFFPAFWGFMAAVVEFVGGIMIMLGLYTRLWSGLLFFTMFVASAFHYYSGDNIFPSHAVELSIVFLSLVFTGAGKYQLFSKFSSHSQLSIEDHNLEK